MDLHPSFLCSFCLLPVLQQIDGDQRDCTCSEWGWKWSGAGGTTRGWEGKKQGWPQCQGSSLLWASFYGVSQVELIWLPLVIPSGVFSLIDHLNSLSWTSNDFFNVFEHYLLILFPWQRDTCFCGNPPLFLKWSALRYRLQLLLPQLPVQSDAWLNIFDLRTVCRGPCCFPLHF